jgi:anaphase-promoting complex subunit 8
VLTCSRAAELLNSFPSSDDDGSDTDVDSPMSDARLPHTPQSHATRDPIEARLEAREMPKYLLAKSFFDCREFDRCAAVFLPGPLPRSSANGPASPPGPSKPGKGKMKLSTPTKPKPTQLSTQPLSQKALFLALYAKYMAGEKRKNEDSEMILGPQDGGVTQNKELSGITTVLDEWFANLSSSGRKSQGWLEYLYGIVLAKGKNEDHAKEYLLQSVQRYPFNWGAWQELGSLLATVEEVSVRTASLASVFLTIF